MRRLLLILCLLALPSLGLAQDRPDCIEVTTSARWGAAAYNHYVRIANHCDRSARCEVSTNVNPQVQTVSVAAGQSTEVITYRGSPAREFTPIVLCTLN